MVTIGWSVGWSAGPTVQSFRPDWKHKRWDHIWAEISEVFLSWKACWLRDDCFREILVLAMVVSSVKHDPRGTSCCRTTYILLNSFPCHLRACRPPGQLPWDSRAFPGPISIELWHIVSVFGTYLWPCFGGFKLLFTWVECQDLMEHMIS